LVSRCAALEAQLAAVSRERDLLAMRRDWLALQLSWRDEENRADGKKKARTRTPEQRKAQLKLGEQHAEQYAQQSQALRLEQLDLSVFGYQRLKKGVRERLARTSQIPEADVEAAIEQFIRHPQIGAQKAHLSLLDREEAMISSTFCNEIKQQLSMLVGDESEKRRVSSQLAKELEARLSEKTQAFDRIHAEAPHEIWATDFLHLSVLGRWLYVCMIYDVYSQCYLAVQVGEVPNRALAEAAIRTAAERTGRRPRYYVLHDNGKAFCCGDYETVLFKLSLSGQAIPPGCPWLNGSLESNNQSLRATILTVGIQDLAEAPSEVRKLGADLPALVRKMQGYCDRARVDLNEAIARPKFGTAPQVVLDGKLRERRQSQEAFVKRKKLERAERMAAVRAGKLSAPHKTLEAKVRAAAQQAFKKIDDEQLYALGQLLQGKMDLLSA
jgi:hypothetical protein